MTHALVEAAIICLAGAALEALFAGSKIRERFHNLRFPSYSPPFWGWVTIGVIYYLICLAVWLRLLLLPASSLRSAAMILAGTFMFANAFWNFFFFRRRNLYQAFILGLVYSSLAIALLVVLGMLDSLAMWCLSPYVAYLLFAGVWSYRVWKANATN